MSGEGERPPPTTSITSLRIPIIKKGEYDLWCMKMRQYIAITDHGLWDVIINANAKRNNEKALDILLSAIPDGHLLKFHNAKDAKTLWASIKAREDIDTAYDRFQNILIMLELYGAPVSSEDANLKFLRSLPPMWHIVATMIRGQPGLDSLDFDDL
ncbi:hypothetical protein Tco_0253913, partial [Tanacetum coccineum]